MQNVKQLLEIDEEMFQGSNKLNISAKSSILESA